MDQLPFRQASGKPRSDSFFESVTWGEEQYTKDKLKSQWAKLEAVVVTEERLTRVANDIIQHFENRLAATNGNGMTVCMSRICVDLYNQIIQLCPDWHSDSDKQSSLKVIITGSASDPESFRLHISSKQARDAIANRLRDP